MSNNDSMKDERLIYLQKCWENLWSLFISSWSEVSPNVRKDLCSCIKELEEEVEKKLEPHNTTTLRLLKILLNCV